MYKNTFQVAWITNDVERAARVFKEEQGVDLAVFRGFSLDVFDGDPLVIDVALGYVADVQFEIIEPVSGPTDLYTRHLPASGEYVLKFHHLCNRFDTVDEYEKALAADRERGVTIAVDGSFGESGRFAYADTRDTLGVYQEYVVLDSDMSFLDSLPRN
ncbi:VOC family protein [Gordonia caeni]|uniref:VOC family protein n=1 Tax=Gordonia caeni TaxID=1007097 RepID=A0ABP7PI09_9ACTN